MEFWSCLSEQKGFVSDETISHTDSLTRNRNSVMDMMKIPSTFQSQDFGELGLPELIDKHQSNDPVRDDVLSDKVFGERNTTNNTTSMASPNLFSGENESSSRLSSSIMESNNSRDSSLFDLKLGRLADNRDAYSSMLWKGSSVLSSSESSTPPKRIRVSGVYSQMSTAACCQVYGCNKDLSSSKDYHKRHKVCETHSKTSKAIVKGIEQRFCQQCSRFHLLAEFDEGKRSCRKRLAGHNERRRKPQGGIHSRRAERLLQSYNASRFGGSTLTTASFICQDILPSAILDPENYRVSDWCWRVKVEDGTQFRPLSGVPVTNGHLHLKSVLPSYEIGKQYPPDRENASIFSDTGSQFPHDLRGLNSGSHSIFQETSLGGENYNVINTTAPTVQGLSRISDSGCALSLLSSESQKSPSHSSGIPMARRMIMPVSHTHYSLIQVSDKLMEGCSQASSSGFSNKHPSLTPMMISSGTDTDDFCISDGIFQGSHFVNNRDSRLSCNGGTTIDLIQLSSQLQRVQDQRQSQQVKQGNDAFCRHRIT